MFTSDKDLRKPVAKKVSLPVRLPRPHISGSKALDFQAEGSGAQGPAGAPAVSNPNDILEIARHERELRTIQRERLAYVIKLQAWWRSRHSASKYFANLAAQITNKLDDINKIMQVFEQKGSPVFVTPAPIGFTLVRQFNFLARDSANSNSFLDLLTRVCRLVVLPCVSELDTTKNMVSHQFIVDSNMYTLVRFFCVCMHHLLPPMNKPKKLGRKQAVSPRSEVTVDKSSISLSLQALVGAHAPFKMKYSVELRASFYRMRRVIADRHGGGLALLRGYFMKKCNPLLTMVIASEAAESESQRITACSRPKDTTDVDRLFALCLFFVESDVDAEPRKVGDFLRQFLYHILSVPMLTLLLTTDTLQAFSRWTLFHSLLLLAADPAGVQCPGRPSDGPSCLKVISTGQWLLGNFTSLALFVCRRPVTSDKERQGDCFRTSVAAEIGAEDVLLYLDVCTAWLSAFSVPEILQGRSGIFWQQQGANSIAVAVPSGLEEQILTLLHSTVLADLSRLAASAIATPLDCVSESPGDQSALVQEQWASSYGLAGDLKDVREALASNGYVIAHTTLRDHQEEATWFTAKWAKRVTSTISNSLGFSSLLSSSAASSSSHSKNTKPSGGGTAVSGHPAGAVQKVAASRNKDDQSSADVAPLIFSLCALWAILLPAAANAAPNSLPWKALSQLAFSGTLLPKLWCFLLDQRRGELDGLAQTFSTKGADQKQFNVLFSLVSVLRMVLIVLDDSELYEAGRPLPLHQILRLVRCLKLILFKVLRDDPSLLLDARTSSQSVLPATPVANGKAPAASPPLPSSSSLAEEGVHGAQQASRRRQLHYSMRAVSSVLADLYSRWARRPFSSSALWEIKEAGGKDVLVEIQQRTTFGQALLRVMPWSVDFHERMKIFRAALDAERLSVQGSNDAFSGPQRSRGVIVKVRKARILEDGMEAMARVGGAIKDRIVVKYVNDFGEEEAGIDAGGLFKDFVTDLSGRIFDPNYGLFCTTSANLMYPNPSAALLFEPHEMDAMFVFLGRVLGKALFENITLQPQFAHFFLAFMHGKYNFMNLINDLSTLDPELYKNLMFLKAYEGDIADLGLTFSVTDTSMGGQKEVELLPGGASMDVTSHNRHRYINLAAKYYLHDRLKRQAKAFFSGLYQVVQPELLQIFCAPELQILISGSQTGLSVEDLRRHTHYAGGYVSLDTHMSRFWSVVAELSQQDQALLLKFVTSCERPPSLGFASLQPPFTIQRVDCSDDQRLPTASTCFNILKLPTYSSARILKQKLLQSIHAKAGFDLS